MARKPAKRHVIAEVRLRAGLSQSELAELLGCAAVTVQRIEQAKLSLSEELAGKAQEALDISAPWLLANKPTKPITPRGGEWSKEFYESQQGSRSRKYREILREITAADEENALRISIALDAAEAGALIEAMLEGTKGLPKQGILLHRLRETLKTLQETFTPDERTLEKHRPKIEKLRKEYDELVEQITKQETKRLWSDNPDESKK